MEIYTPDTTFDFNQITLDDPSPVTGVPGTYFIKINVQKGDGLVAAKNNMFYLQFPKCVLKTPFVEVSLNSKSSDLVYDRKSYATLLEWIENLHFILQDKIFERRTSWFKNSFTKDDIETMLRPMYRLTNGGKHISIKVLAKTQGPLRCIAYNEKEIGIDLDDIEANKSLIPLLLIEGVRFSTSNSNLSFEIDVSTTQMMVLQNTPSRCLIKSEIPKEKELVKDNELLSTKKNESINPVLDTSNVEEVATTVIAEVINDNTVAASQIEKIESDANSDITELTVVSETTSTPANETLIDNAAAASASIDPMEVNVDNAELIIVENSSLSTEEVANIKIDENLTVDIIKPTIANEISITQSETIEKSEPPLAIKPMVITPEPFCKLPANISTSSTDLVEVTLDYHDAPENALRLKNRTEVYREMYDIAYARAKELRLKSIEAYLEAKNIKNTYLISELINESDDDNDEGESEGDDNSEGGDDDILDAEVDDSEIDDDEDTDYDI
jgi:hypothetical protein